MNDEKNTVVVKDLGEQIDLEELEANGVITKEGDWYRINRFDALPEQASNSIAKIEQDEKGIKVKFIDATAYESNLQYMDAQPI